MRRPQRRTKAKRKNRLAAAEAWPPRELARMAQEAHYESSDFHKAVPDDRSMPKRRADKTVCHERDGRYPNAHRLLRMGFRRGMVSVQQRNGWPRHVWAVDSNGVAYEGMLTNQGNGQYHGHPMVAKLRFTKHIVAQWGKRT